MGLEFISDRPRNFTRTFTTGNSEDAPAQAADGRTLIGFASQTYNADGTVDTVTSRSFNKDIALPKSGNSTTTSVVKSSD